MSRKPKSKPKSKPTLEMGVNLDPIGYLVLLVMRILRAHGIPRPPPGTVLWEPNTDDFEFARSLQSLYEAQLNQQLNIQQLRIKGRRPPGKETLFETQMTAAMRAYGLDEPTIAGVWRLFAELGAGPHTEAAAKRQQASRASRR
jgi:hypothetical protein